MAYLEILIAALPAHCSEFSRRGALVHLQGAPEHQLALPLLILMAQQRHAIAVQHQSPHLKLIAELYDKCQEALYQVCY